MHIIIVYATTEGQTRKICGSLATQFRTAGHRVEVLDAADLSEDYVLPAADRVIVAASLHNGQYQSSVVHFVASQRKRLDALQTAFISVSLAAAGHSEEDRRGLAECIDRFVSETGWVPQRIEHVAGAFRFTQYDFLKRWAMKYIAWRKGEPTDTSQDREYTDWQALTQFATAFTAGR